VNAENQHGAVVPDKIKHRSNLLMQLGYHRTGEISRQKRVLWNAETWIRMDFCGLLRRRIDNNYEGSSTMQISPSVGNQERLRMVHY
jgi:hypothetical protein